MPNHIPLKERLHPLCKEWLRSFLANTSMPALLALFLLVLVVSAAFLAGLSQWYDWSQGKYDFSRQFGHYLSFFLRGAFHGGYEPGPWTLLYRLLLHTLLLGGLVYKLLLTSNLFRFRRRFSVYWDDRKNAWYLAIRPYNASRMDILDVNFKAILRAPRNRAGDRVLPNRTIQIEAPKEVWLYAIPMVPYTVPIRLQDGDVEIEAGEPRLVKIQGHEIEPEDFDADGESFLVITVTGQVPRLGRSIIQSHWYRLTHHHQQAEYDWGRPVSIQTKPGRQPQKSGGRAFLWPGWRRFEGTESPPLVGYVFAFGSLVNPEEYPALRAKFRLGPKDAEGYCLEDYRRVWDVAMDNSRSIPGYKRYADPAGAYPEVFVAFADIEAAPGARVHGVLIPVHQRLLDHLDRRERNYERTKVAVQGKADDQDALPIWAYLGSDNGKERFRAGQLLQRVCVTRDYRERIVQAYQARGLADEFQAEDAGFDLEVRELSREDIPNVQEQ